MSHSVQVSVALESSAEYKALEALHKEISSCADVYKEYLSEELGDMEESIKKAFEFVQSTEFKTARDGELLEYQRNLSSLAKRVANIKSSFSYGDAYSKMAERKDQSINKIITENGLMAIMAIEDLENEGKNISSDELLNKIEENRAIEIDKNVLSKLKKQIQMQLIDMELPDEIKFEFVQMFHGSLTRQEIVDLFALIENKVVEFRNIEEISKTIIKGLETLDFKYTNSEYFMTEKGEIEIKLNLFKDKTKDFSLTINTSRRMSWQFGDYEEHMCDADGEKFREEILPSLGLKLSSAVITRNKSRSRPLRQARALKMKGL